MKSILCLCAFTAALSAHPLHAALISGWSTADLVGSTAPLPVASVIPEPTIGLLIGIAGIALLSFRRR